MSVEPLHLKLTPRDIPLENIFLDPNNPRFVSHNWQMVADAEIPNEANQEYALKRLLTEFGADKLRSNMELNGYLPIDRIIVRAIGPDKFVVLEGNRRIAAAKSIGAHSASGETINPQVNDSLKVIPALEYTGSDSQAAWVFQGLRHITGINDWSAYNKARLLVEQMEKESLSQTEVGRRFGLTAFGAGQWIRGYQAFRQAKVSTSFAAEVDERLYPYLQELFGRSSIAMRNWLGWNDAEKKFSNIDYLDEFIGWFYPRTSSENDASDETQLGDWEKRYIGKRDDIRQLAYLIEKSPKNFEIFRTNHDLEAAYGKATVEEYEQKLQEGKDQAERVLATIRLCAQALQNIPLAMIKKSELKLKLDAELAELKNALDFVAQ